MSVLILIGFAAIFLILFFLPGLALGRLTVRGMDFPEKVAVGLGMALFGMPAIFYAACNLINRAESIPLYIGLCAIIYAIGYKHALASLKGLIRRRDWSAGVRKYGALGLICLATFGFRMVNYEGPAEGYWDTYMTAPAMMMANAPVEFVDKAGHVLYDYKLPGTLPGNLVNNDAYDIATKDQRLGGGVVYATAFLMFNLFGFRLFYALQGLLLSLAAYLILRRFAKVEWVALFAAALFANNPYVFAVNELNPNFSSLALLSLMIALLVRKNGVPGVAVGLLFGFFGVLRMEGVIFGPAVLLAIFLRENKWKTLGAAIFAGMLVLWPLFTFNQYAFHDPFMHPTQYKGHTGFRPTFEHHFFGKTFEFNGMLNWPFYTEVVRTPHFPFPTFILLPLTVTHTFGAVLMGLAFLGLAPMWKRQKGWLAFCLLWLGPFLAVFLFQENWEELKTTFILLAFPPLCWLMCMGADWLFEKGSGWPRWAVCLALVACVSLTARSFSNANFKLDERWYKRFPLAKEDISGVTYFGDSVRKHWNFYHTRESEREFFDQRAKFSRGNLLPNLYYPMHPETISPSQTWKEIRREVRQRSLTTLDVWRYVYTEIEKTGEME